MDRFFISREEAMGGVAHIVGEDARHISRVLRLRPGDEILLLDGCGAEYPAYIEAVEGQEVRARLDPARPCMAEPGCAVTLYQALPKAGKMEAIIQKCVELGVHRVQPVLTHRCVARPEEFSKKQQRYQRVAYEAAKQARRGIVPEVGKLATLAEVAAHAHEVFLLAYEEERKVTLKMAAAGKCPKSAAVCIGPEGGFTQEEAAMLKERGAVSVTLGPRILRTETAGMAMLAMLQYEWEA